ncbi:GGDEF domain-containing protein [Ruminococcus sp. NK3A76]|uniref:diguanylate cyclase domain-containing protein n=1 Tax=Ruminococcus sp. NK3A76 TaxID=877411 RepID=UPI00048C8C22|nr:GGDEF domain-containing protein [Ruminococcus sp. NK3A76]
MDKKNRYVLGMLVANITDPFSNQAAKGAMAAAEQLDVNLILIPGKYICDTSYANSDTTYEYQYNNLFRYASGKSLDAVCVCTGTIAYASSEEEKREFVAQFCDVPTVSVAAAVEGFEYVVYDNVQSVRDAVNFMIKERGVSRIACLTGADNTDCEERLEGYKLALDDNGIPVDDEFIIYANTSRVCKEDFARFLDKHPETQAVVCANDDMCIGVYELCAERGITVGSDMLVVGFDDMDYAEKLDPPLASVRASAEDLGYFAIVNAVRLIEGREIERRNVPTRFIPRASCGYVDRAMTDIDLFLADITPDRLNKVLCFIYDGTDACRDPVLIGYMQRIIDTVVYVEKNGVMTRDMAHDIKDVVKAMMDYNKQYYMFIKKTLITADAVYHRLSTHIKDAESKAVLENLYLEIYRTLSRDVGVQIFRAGEESVEMLRRSNIVVRDTLMVRSGGNNAFADLLRRLPLLEVDSSFMYLLPEPVSYKKGDEFYDFSRWRFVAYSDHENMYNIDESERDMPLTAVYRNKYMPDRRFTLVMADLYSGEQQFGMLLCELKSQFFEYLEFITYQFGAAVRIINLINELERHMKKLRSDNVELAGISRADELTGLLNRRGFKQAADEMFEKGRASGKRAVIVFADLDYLKFINDRFGHNEGDYALKASASILKKIFGPSAVIGRTGGDEFNILAFPEDGKKAEKHILELKQAYVEELNESSDKPYRIDLSMGICEFDCSDTQDLQSVIELADDKLYAVKRARTYDPYKQEKPRA